MRVFSKRPEQHPLTIVFFPSISRPPCLSFYHRFPQCRIPLRDCRYHRRPFHIFGNRKVGVFLSFPLPDRQVIEQRVTVPWWRETDFLPFILRSIQSDGDLHHHTIHWTRGRIIDFWVYQPSELSFCFTDRFSQGWRFSSYVLRVFF